MCARKMVLCTMQFIRRNFLLVICLLIIFTNFAYSGVCRIISGNEVAIEKYPYQLSLQKDKTHICGAVVIHKTWILTSAACLKGLSTSSVTLRAGSSYHHSGGTLYTIKNIITHPNFNDATKDYNIALLQTSQAIDAKIAKPIPLVSEGSIVNSGTNVIVTGWGVLTAGGTIFPEKLQQILVPIIDGQVCKVSNGNLYSDRMLCAGFTSGGKDICTGDYGGPMVYQDKLIGISSWSKTCGKPGSFGTYTSISKLRDWIKKTSGV